jgi:hypothetical protein
MPKSMLPTPDSHFEAADGRSPAGSIGAAAESRPSVIEATDQRLAAIDDDLAELEALLAGPAVTVSPDPRNAGPSASSGSGARARGTTTPQPTKSAAPPAKGKPSESHGLESRDTGIEDDLEALVGLDCELLSPWDDADGPAQPIAASSASDSPAVAHPPDKTGRWALAARAAKHACRTGAQTLTFGLAILDRPFCRLSIRVKIMLGYAAWATLFVSAGTWMYALLAA